VSVGTVGKPERIYHFHIRKTGGSSLDSAFLALGGSELGTIAERAKFDENLVEGNGLKFVQHDIDRIAAGDYFFASSHEPIFRLRIPPGTFTLTILRDPVARAVSYLRYLLWARANPTAYDLEPYLDKVRTESEFLDGGARFLRSEISTHGIKVESAVRELGMGQYLARLSPYRPDLGRHQLRPDLHAFLARVPPRRLLTQLYMFSKRLDPKEAAANVLNFSEVCFTETFSADLARLGERLGLDLQEKRERSFGEKISLSDSERSVLRKRLKPEYEMVERVRDGLNR
jgi:hypothetical protein